jgi:hypothetical protein
MSYCDRERWPEHPALFAMIVWYVVAGFLVAGWFHFPGMMSALTSTLFAQWTLLLAVPYLAFITIRARMAARDAQGNRVTASAGWSAAWTHLRASHLSPRRLRDVVILTSALGLFLNAFSCWKYGMAMVRSFSADPLLSHLDIMIHGGHPAWALLQPWLGHPWITALIDITYEPVWFATVAFMVLAMAWEAPSEHRTRFFVAFVLTWSVAGTGLAYLLPSAGPCYYHLFVGGPDPYQGLLSYLQAVGTSHDLTSLHIRSALLRVESGGVSTAGAGIAAMPSMHVALPALFAWSTWTSRRGLSLLLFVYTGLVLVSSVHLGWHYAIDGYVGLLSSLATWHLAGLLERSSSRAEASGSWVELRAPVRPILQPSSPPVGGNKRPPPWRAGRVG